MTTENNNESQTQLTPETASAATTPETSTPASASTDLGSEEASPETPETSEEGAQSTDSSAPTTPATDLGSDEEAEEAAPEARPYDEFIGPPETDYEDFVLPDGAVADEELRGEFTPLAKELGLSQKGAQRLVDFKAKLDQTQLQRWGDHLTSLKQAAQADPEIGGARYAPAVSAAKAALAKFGTPELRTALNQYGLGAHKELIRMLAKVHAATGETPVGPGGAPAGGNKPLHELMYDKDI